MSLLARPDHEIVAAVIAAAAMAFPGTASADATTRPARVDYEAPAACPDARAFEGQIRARSSRITLGPDAATTVRVRILGRARRFEGDVVILDPASAQTQQRRVEGTCTDVVAALALIAALALDPTASTAAAPAADASQEPAPAPKPAETKPPTPPPAPPSPPKAPETGEPSDERPPASELAKHDWRWSIGAGAAVTGGIAPSLLVSIPGFVDVARVGPGVLSPAFRLRAQHATVDADGASFAWTVGSFDVCPVAFTSGPLRVWPCARVTGGALAGTGDVSHSLSSSRPWLSAGVVARGRLALVGGLFVELEAEAFAPFVRDRFYLEPDATVHEATAVAATGAASVGASFW